jgi:hypothetical protein
MAKKVFSIIVFLMCTATQSAEQNSIFAQKNRTKMVETMVEGLQPFSVTLQERFPVTEQGYERIINNRIVKVIQEDTVESLQHCYTHLLSDINKPLYMVRWRFLQLGLFIDYDESHTGVEGEEVDIKQCGTPLEFSLKYRKLECARWLLKQGAALDHPPNKLPLLHRAAQGDMDDKPRLIRREVVELLLERGASVHERTTWLDTNDDNKEIVVVGHTALGACVSWEHFFEYSTNHTACGSPYDIAQLLVEKGAQLSGAYKSGFAHPFIMEAYWPSPFKPVDIAWILLKKLLYKRVQVGYRDAMCCMLSLQHMNNPKIPKVLRPLIVKNLIDDTLEDVIGGLDGRVNEYGIGVNNLKASYDILAMMKEKQSKHDRQPFIAQRWCDDYTKFNQIAIQEKLDTSDWTNTDAIEKRSKKLVELLKDNLIWQALSFKFE